MTSTFTKLGVALGGLALAAIWTAPANAQAAGQWTSADHVYQKICTYCHDTGIGPKIKGQDLPDVYVQHVVRNGKKAMPAFRPSDIDDAMLADLAKYIAAGGVAEK